MNNYSDLYTLYKLAVDFDMNRHNIYQYEKKSTIFDNYCCLIRNNGSIEERIYKNILDGKNFDCNIDLIINRKVTDPFLIYIYFRNLLNKNLIDQLLFRRFILLEYGKIVSAVLSYDIVINFGNYFLLSGKPDLKSIHYYLRLNSLHNYILLKKENEQKIYALMTPYL